MSPQAGRLPDPEAGPSVSVAIASRGRVPSLLRTLTALRQQRLAGFEVVVVVPEAERAQLADAPEAHGAVLLTEERANISASRNAGIAAARGTVVALLDDDAVPEPAWLARLIAPFADPAVGATTGYVRGRNGVSFQWRGLMVDRLGEDHPLPGKVPDAGQVVSAPDGMALKTQGTNCAFRRAALEAAGGFDEALHYFLDEVDLDLRLAALGWGFALVPGAEVHHGFAPSAHRLASRVPRDLFEIGASKAHFLRVHADSGDVAPALADFRRRQRNRLIRFMEFGQLAPGAVDPLMARLDAGFAEGTRRASVLPGIAPAVQGGLRQFVAPRKAPVRRIALAGKPGEISELKSRARELVGEGAEVSILAFGTSTRMLTVSYETGGFWLHRGGILGQGARSEALVQLRRWPARVVAELARIAPQRGISKVELLGEVRHRHLLSAGLDEPP